MPERSRPAGTGTRNADSREREVAVLDAQGLTDRQIAGELRISPDTATRHVRNVLRRLGFQSRAQVAVWAVQQGLTQRI